MRRWLPDVWITLALLIIPVVFFWPVTVGDRTLVPADNLYQYEPWATYRQEVGAPETPHNALLSDLVLQNYQWKTFIRQNIEDTEIPLWQPNQFSGTTFLANGQHSMLYPFSLIYYVLPLEDAFGWFTVSQLWLAGFLMYLFIRGIGLGRVPGLVAALTVQLSSFFVVSTVHPMIQAGAAWLPLILLMAEFIIRRRPFPLTGERPAMLPWALIGGVGLGMAHLAGHLEIVYYTLLVAAFYSACRLLWEWWKERTAWRGLIMPSVMLVGMVVLGFALGAVQFIPGVEAAQNSFRTAREDSTFQEVRDFSLPNRHAAKFIMPNVYGNPSHHRYFDVFEGETVELDWTREDGTQITNTDFGIKNYVEGGVYLGILPLVLAVIGLYMGVQDWRKKRRPNAPPVRLVFLLLILVALSFMFGTLTYAVLYYGFPGINQLHTPFRWIWPFTIGVAVLAAFGADALGKQAEERSSVSRVGWLLILAGVIILLGLLGTRLFYDAAEPVVERLYTGLAGAANVFPDTQSFYSYQFQNVFILGLMISGTGLVLYLSQTRLMVGRNNRKLPAWQVLAVSLILIDLFIANYGFNTAAKKEWLAYTPPPVEWLQTRMEEEGPFRIQAYNWGEEPLIANSGWRYGLHDVRGYDSLFSQEYAEMMQEIAPQGGLAFNRIDSIFYVNSQALAHPLLDWLNVRYVITDWRIFEAERLGYRLADGAEWYRVGSEVRIYENTNALPRAFTLPRDGNTPLRAFACPANPNLDALTLPSPCNAIQAAVITQYDDIELRIDAIVEQDSWLILADGYDDGWRAYVKPKGASDNEEHEVDVERAIHNLRAVKLAPGEWTIRFRYSPPSFQLGAFISFVSFMLFVFIALIWFWRTFVGENAEKDTAHRLMKNSLAPILLNLFNRGIDFAFAFIMLRILGPEDAGIYYYAIVIFGWFDIFTNFGLNTLLTREVSRDKAAAGRYVYNTSILRIGLALLSVPVLLGVLWARNATVTPELDVTAIIAILLLYIGLIPNSISTGLSALFYAFEKAEFPAAIATVTTLVKVTLGLGALLIGWGVIGLAGASIVTNLVTLVIMGRLAWPLLKDSWQPVREGGLQRLMIRESWPLMVNHLLATVFFKIDVVLMEAINGVAVVGVYSTAYKWLDALNIIPAFFTMALLPVMARQAHQNAGDLKRTYLLGTKLLFIVSIPTAVFTTFLATGLVGFLGGPQFLPDGAIALQMMIWSIPIGWMNSLTQYVLIALDRQRQITGAFIVAVSFNIITNLIFLPLYSFRAAAITTIFSEMVLFVGFYWLILRAVGGVNWLSLLWRPAMAGGGAVAALWVLWEPMPLLALPAGVLTYVLLMWILQPFSDDEAARLAPLLPGRLRYVLFRKLPKHQSTQKITEA